MQMSTLDSVIAFRVSQQNLHFPSSPSHANDGYLFVYILAFGLF